MFFGWKWGVDLVSIYKNDNSKFLCDMFILLLQFSDACYSWSKAPLILSSLFFLVFVVVRIVLDVEGIKETPCTSARVACVWQRSNVIVQVGVN